jgi:hypothetical protein
VHFQKQPGKLRSRAYWGNTEYTVMSANIFISFASQDRKIASTLCKALESRGFECWISDRDILPGENFQIAIVQAIRRAKIMLLVFTGNSNNSQEMTKELALASQQKLIVIPLRVEDVAPNDAFAYEFATRQWIDCFADWEFAMDQLSQRISNAIAAHPDSASPVVAGAQARAADFAPVTAESGKAPVEAATPAVEAPTLAVAPAAEEPGSVHVAPAISISDLMSKSRDSRPQSVDLVDLEDEAISQAALAAAAPRSKTPLRLALMAAGLAAVVGLGLAIPALMHSKPATAQVAQTPPPVATPRIAVATLQPLDPGQAPPGEAAASPTDAAAPAADKPAPKRKARKVAAPTVDIPY